MLKPGLQLVLGQHLTITPQLQQVIRLLQLPAHELELEIRAALEGNIMLEAEGDSAWGDAEPERAGEDAARTPEQAYAGPDDAGLPQYMTAGGRAGVPTGEDAARPLSDGAIAERLNGPGVQAARRTVVEYREARGIPARGLRRRRGGAGFARPARRFDTAGAQTAWRATA